MPGWGEVLETIHLAPRGVETVRLVVSHQHSGATATPRPSPGAPVPSTARAGRAIGTAAFIAASGADPDPAIWRSELWCDAHGRHRIRRGQGTMTVVDGTDRWIEMGDDRVVRAPVGDRSEQEPLLLLASPEALLGWFRFEDHDERSPSVAPPTGSAARAGRVRWPGCWTSSSRDTRWTPSSMPRPGCSSTSSSGASSARRPRCTSSSAGSTTSTRR